jgi:hypothetical protein
MIKDHDDPMYAITAQDRHGVQIGDDDNYAIRKLTPARVRAPARIPRWVDRVLRGWNQEFPIHQRYERCGRTISIPVVEAMGRKLHEFY